jgi:ATP synthase protein I
MEVAVSDQDQPDDLDRRRRDLEKALAAKRPKVGERVEDAGAGGLEGFGRALRLSSEFLGGVAVGVAIGWFIDKVAGTSPWGLIVFLLLGFAAGVLNVMRSAGLIAQPGQGSSKTNGLGGNRNE